MIRCADGSLYTGITTDLERRLAEHRSGGPRAARYLRGRGPLELVYSVTVEDKSAALRMEALVKRLPRARKLDLVAGRVSPPGG